MSKKTDTEIATQTTPGAGDIVFQSQTTIPALELNALSSSINNEEAVDPITKAIREEILQKQRDILREYLADSKNLENLKLDEQAHKILIEQIKDDEKFREFLKNLKDDEEKRKLINAALNDQTTKEKFEAVEIAGYKKVHTDFKDSFKTIAWDGPTGEDANENTTKSQKITNDVDGEICTLTETTHATKPISVTKSDGTEVKVNSYRTIDFPVKLNGANGNMHLSIVALDENGNRPPIDKAVYFTAHYEEGPGPAPDDKPLLKEVSSPMPIKFMGEGKDAIGYVEHGGKIYTMPVTRGKYEEMMQEVAANKGQGVNLSQTVKERANDKVMNMSQEQGDKSIVDQDKAVSEKYKEEILDTPKAEQATLVEASQPQYPETKILQPTTPPLSQVKPPAQHLQPLPAKAETVSAPKVQTLTSEEVYHSKAQAIPLVKESTFYGAIQDVADSLRGLDKEAEKGFRSNNSKRSSELHEKVQVMKTTLSSSAPVISSKKIINEKELSTSTGISKANKGGGRVL